MGVHNYFKYFDGFGFTERTGIDLPGEASPQYYKENQYGIVELSSASFGQTACAVKCCIKWYYIFFKTRSRHKHLINRTRNICIWHRKVSPLFLNICTFKLCFFIFICFFSYFLKIWFITTFNCTGSIRVEDYIMNCHYHPGHGHENLTQGLGNSCNQF